MRSELALAISWLGRARMELLLRLPELLLIFLLCPTLLGPAVVLAMFDIDARLGLTLALMLGLGESRLSESGQLGCGVLASPSSAPKSTS